jgi:hypothetical protein
VPAVVAAGGGKAAYACGSAPSVQEMAVMRKLLGTLVILLALVGALGYWMGWFQVGKPKSDDGKTHYSITVDRSKFEEDKERFRKLAAEKMKALQDQIAGLRGKHKGQTGEEKAKTEKEIEDLNKQHESIGTRLKEFEEAAEDKIEGARKRLEEHLRGRVPPKEEKSK